MNWKFAFTAFVSLFTLASGIELVNLQACAQMLPYQSPLKADTVQQPTTELPSFEQVLLQRDPHAQLNPVGWVRFGNQSQYIIAEPAHAPAPAAIKLAFQIPENPQEAPDIMGFTDGHVLIRVIQLPNGRATLPLIEDLPLAVKTAYIPKTTFFPSNFLVPTVWKSLTADLLTTQDEDARKQRTMPFVTLSSEGNVLMAWNPHQAKAVGSWPLPCQGQALAVAYPHIFIGCVSQPKLLDVNIQTQSLKELNMPASVAHLAFDDRLNELWVAFSSPPQNAQAHTTLSLENSTVPPEPVAAQQPTKASFLGVLSVTPTGHQLAYMPFSNPIEGAYLISYTALEPMRGDSTQ